MARAVQCFSVCRSVLYLIIMSAFIFTFLTEHSAIFLFLFATLVLVCWSQYKTSINTFYDYALASRTLSIGVLVMSVLATRVGSGDLAEPDRVFSAGLIQALLSVVFIVSFLLTGAFIAPRFIHFPSCLTLGDLMSVFFGRFAQVAAGVLSYIFSVLIISTQIKAIGNISYHILGISSRDAILFFSLFTILYSLWGGVRSVSYTDILQGIACLLVLGYIAQNVLQKAGGEALWEKLPSEKFLVLTHPNLHYHLKDIAFWNLVPVFILTPPIVQRMLMVQDRKQAKKVWYIGAILYGITLFLLTIIGLAAFVGKDKIEVSSTIELLPNLVKQLFKGNGLLTDIMFLGLAAILLSTMDSYLHATGISVVQDIIVPVRLYFFGKKLEEKQKLLYSRIGIVITGLISMGIGLFGKAQLENDALHEYATITFSIVLIPLIIGIIGVKTDIASLAGFFFVYVGSISILRLLLWGVYESFIVAVIMGFVAYFMIHMVRNQGLVFVERTSTTIRESPWRPSLTNIIKQTKDQFIGCLQLSEIARKQLIKYPNGPLHFSLLIFIMYTCSIVLGVKGEYGMKGIHLIAIFYTIGVVLCCGLLLEEIWPRDLKVYFPCYWIFTLFFCFPVCGTLTSLCSYDNWGMIHIGCGMILFIYLVGHHSAFLLGTLGVCTACSIWTYVFDEMPNPWAYSISMGAIFSLITLVGGIFLFIRQDNHHLQEKHCLNKLASGRFAHEMRHSLNMLGGTGFLLQNTFTEGSVMSNKKGEKGFWIPQKRHDFLNEFASVMVNKSEEVNKELERFIKFIDQQAFGGLAQENISICKIVKDSIESLSSQYKERVTVVMDCKQDFYANRIANIFPSIIMNLIRNAYLHGSATHVLIEVNGEKHTIRVRDNGSGIPPEILHLVFDLFYTSGQGNGVGLTFVKMGVEASGGHISCHSKYMGKGSYTEFVIQLP